MSFGIKLDRLRAIIDGTASNLSTQEILIRHVAFQAEREGKDPVKFVLQELPQVKIIRDETGSFISNTSPAKTHFKLNVRAKSLPVQQRSRGFTESQEKFFEKHKIPYSRIFDARDLKKREYALAMHKDDYIVAVNVTPCTKHGHQIRSRHGHCVQCNTAALEFQDRKYRNGFVYVCYSAKHRLTKIGMTDTPDRRLNVLKKQGYASADDWEIIYCEKIRHAGLIEYEAQRLIEDFRIERTYAKDGRTQSCYEIFCCSPEDAITAVRKAIGLYDSRNDPV